MDISEFTKDKFPFAYEQASNMCEALSKVLKKKLPETEVGYLAFTFGKEYCQVFKNILF